MITNEQATIKSITDFEPTPQGMQSYWLVELTAAEKELEKWHERGKKIVKLYLDDREGDRAAQRFFNLFHANTNLMQAALYAKIPKVEVSRRNADFEDDVARVAGLILERAIQYELDTIDDFDNAAKALIQDRLLTGVGTAWIRYDAKFTEMQVEQTEETPTYELQEESTPIDYVYWQDFLWSPARTWKEVRWIARRVYMSKDEAIKRFGEEVGSKLTTKPAEKTDIEPTNEVLEQAEIYEIWDKTSEKVYWCCKEYDEILDVKEDFLNLPNFFPTPRPFFGITTTSNLVPTPDYVIVQDQYEEMNTINSRISLLVDALRVAGIYDASTPAIKQLLNFSGENILVPVDSWAAFSERGGLQGNIDWLPIDMIVKVVGELNAARDVIKNQIYELTGISDIIRGSTNQYETATAQEIKSQYASLRLNSLQQAAAEFFSDLMGIKAFLMAKFYEPQKLLQQAGNILSHDQQFIGPAIELLKNEQTAKFKVKVSVESLSLPNWDYEKKSRTELLASVSKFMEQAIPAAQNLPQLQPLLLGMLKFGLAGYKAGREIEGLIDAGLAQLQQKQNQPQQDKPDPEVVKAQMEAQKLQAEAQIRQQELVLEKEKTMVQLQIEQARLEIEKTRLAMEQVKAQATLALEQQKLNAKVSGDQQKLELDRELGHLDRLNKMHELEIEQNEQQQQNLATLQKEDE